MSIRPFWFIPSHGDGRWLGDTEGARATEFDYLAQVAVAADRLGFEGVLLPTGRTCEDSWVLASALAPLTRDLKFLVAVRPGVTSPLFAARQAATLDCVSAGRLLINVVTGGDLKEMRADGIALAHDDRYRQTDEFLRIWRGLMAAERVDHAGEHLFAEGAELLFPPVQAGGPPLFLGGSSDAAVDITARHIDHYLTWGEPVEAVARKVETVRRAAEAQGRTVRFGIRLHVIVRETEEAAWAEAARLISRLDDATIARAQEGQRNSDSEGQRRMQALHGGNRDRLVVGPNLWAGVGLIRGGAGTALVGSPESLAARIDDYARVGIETFILSGYPHLEEAYRVAELLFPLLPIDRRQEARRSVQPGRAGETGGHALDRHGSELATGPS